MDNFARQFSQFRRRMMYEKKIARINSCFCISSDISWLQNMTLRVALSNCEHNASLPPPNQSKESIKSDDWNNSGIRRKIHHKIEYNFYNIDKKTVISERDLFSSWSLKDTKSLNFSVRISNDFNSKMWFFSQRKTNEAVFGFLLNKEELGMKETILCIVDNLCL